MYISSDSITTDNHSKAIDWSNSQDYDILITGSDEIWKVSPTENQSYFSNLPRPFPNAYFLDPNISAMKTAYAASANTVDLVDLDELQQEKL